MVKSSEARRGPSKEVQKVMERLDDARLKVEADSPLDWVGSGIECRWGLWPRRIGFFAV